MKNALANLKEELKELFLPVEPLEQPEQVRYVPTKDEHEDCFTQSFYSMPDALYKLEPQVL